MTAMKKTTVAMIIVIIWSVMHLVFWLYEYPHTPQPDSVSMAGAAKISTAVGFILKGYPPIEKELLKIRSSDLKSALIKLIETEGWDDDAAERLRTGDGWGRPYNVEWRTNMVGIESPMLRDNQNALLIWSSGENGVNENGNGDDIFAYVDWNI
jgi:hypothetical protein